MGKRDAEKDRLFQDELENLEKLAESFGTADHITGVSGKSVGLGKAQADDINSRLARVTRILGKSLAERNRLAYYLDNILESFDSAVIVTDHYGVINIFNSAAERYTHIKAESALGQKIWQTIDLGRTEKAIETALAGNGMITGNFHISSGNGEKMPLAYSITRMRQKHSRDRAGMVIILHNLSEVKKLEDNLRQVSTLAALGEMAATVAHEIRNPLAGIAGFAALLLRDLEDDSQKHRLVEKINQGVETLNGIVARLLDFTGNIKPFIAEVDAVSVIKEAVSELQSYGSAGSTEKIMPHDIEIKSGSRELRANLDPQLFRMVVFNLVKNAMQANPNGGHIRLTIKRTADNQLNFIVEDDGPGIPEEAFEKLFTPFFTTKAEGTGLGLATVKKLIELHGGRVVAANRPEGGARFVIEIPDQAGQEKIK